MKLTLNQFDCKRNIDWADLRNCINSQLRVKRRWDMHDLIALKELYSKSVESNLIRRDVGRLAGPVFRETGNRVLHQLVRRRRNERCAATDQTWRKSN